MQKISHRKYTHLHQKHPTGVGALVACAVYERTSKQQAEIVSKDPLRPAFGIASEIYDALRSQEQPVLGLFWAKRLRDIALRAATASAAQWGLKEPTAAMVKVAQDCTLGHSDYFTRFANALATLMHQQGAKEKNH